jgi:pimeloyl-ACP methyl ester carboxylesterase
MLTRHIKQLLAISGLTSLIACSALAGGEAGPIHLRDQGHFWVGIRTTEAGPNAVSISGQMYVGFQLVENRTQKYPLILVHGGGGQSTDWMSTPDGRDGWLDYFLAAGFDVYFVDRPAHGRSPSNTTYGELADPPASDFMGFLAASPQWPGDATDPTDPALLQHVASSEPGPTVDNIMLKENFAELLDRVGPAIIVMHSAGGPSGWVSVDARPDLVKGVLAIEAVTDFPSLPLTWEPALAAGERVDTVSVPPTEAGKAACDMQPEDSVRTLPNFFGIPVLGLLAPESGMFVPNYHCAMDFINQAGGDATLLNLGDIGIEGNNHFLNEALNVGETAQVMIDWLETVE